MIYNHYEIQDLTLKDFQEQIGKSVTITFLKPQKLKGYDELKNEFSGVVKKIGPSPNFGSHLGWFDSLKFHSFSRPLNSPDT